MGLWEAMIKAICVSGLVPLTLGKALDLLAWTPESVLGALQTFPEIDFPSESATSHRSAPCTRGSRSST